MRETLIALGLGTSVLFAAATQPFPESRAESKRLCLAGLAAGYNLDYPEALEAYRRPAEVTNVRQ